MSRQPTFKYLHTDHDGLNRVQQGLRETLAPVLANPIFGAADFRWQEIAGMSGAAPTWALQYRTPGTQTWVSVYSVDSTGAIVQPAWNAPTFTNSWVNYGAGTLPAGYFKDSAGIVHLRGAIATGTLNTIAFTLPAGYRPSGALNFPAVANTAFGFLAITSAGGVVPVNGSNVWFSLDGISFDTRA